MEHSMESVVTEEEARLKIFEDFKNDGLCPVDISRFKIPPRVIKSDDCSVTIGNKIEDGEVVDPGTEYFPHAGEYIWMLPVGNLQSFFDLGKFRKFGKIDASSGDDVFDQVEDMEVRFRRLAEPRSKVLVAWTWTDFGVDPLPQP